MTLFDASVGEPALPDPASSARVRATVAYLGGGFRGFAAQRGQRTIAGTLADALERVLRHPVEITCAGRTDAGVHAWGQVISFDVSTATAGAPAGAGPGAAAGATAAAPPDLAAVKRSVNKLLHAEVVIRDIALAPPDFDARRSATSRRYRYTVLNRPEPNPFLAATSWQVEGPLDLGSLQLSCDPIIGEHDFSAFCRKRQDPEAVLVRRVKTAEWKADGDGIFGFEIEASAFCHQMVRSLVSTMVEMGLGRKKAGDMAWILRSRDRANTSGPAPPQGLCLWEVRYD